MKRENRMLAIAAVLSFLAGFVFQHEDSYKVTVSGLFVTAAGMVIYYVWLCARKADSERRRCAALCSVMGLFTLALMQGISWLRLQKNITDEILSMGTIVLFLILALWCAFCIYVERGITENTVFLVLFACFLMKLFYVVMTQGHIVQNDLETLSEKSWGHLGYVYRLFTTGKLPEENPMEYFQFYQPPLHYAISALFLRIYVLFGVKQAEWDEVLQMLPLFYTTAVLVFLNKIGLQLRCSPLGRCVTLGLAGFLSYSIHMGGSLNNDPLTTLFMVMCVYFTIKWYDDPKLVNILTMAMCIGFAMMTKLSGAMIAPAMAVVMLWRAWLDRKQWQKWLKQFVGFGLAAFPLGLWYSVLRWTQFRMPFGYVYAGSVDSPQFIGIYSKWDRFKDYKHALESLSLRWGPAPDVDYNIPVSLVKFSVFNELDYYNYNQSAKNLGIIVFWVTVLIFILSVAAFAVWLFMRRNKMIYKIFLGLGAVVIMFAYVKFCLAYPYVCSMNVRYVMTAVYLGMLVLGAAVSGLEERLAEKGAVAGRLFIVSTSCVVVFYMLSSALLNIHLERLLF